MSRNTVRKLAWAGIALLIIWWLSLACLLAHSESAQLPNPRPALLESWQWDTFVSNTSSPERAYEAAMISYCETKLDSNAVGGEGELGWPQIHPIHGIYPGLLRNPVTAVQIMDGFMRRRPSLSDWPRTRYGCEEWWNG